MSRNLIVAGITAAGLAVGLVIVVPASLDEPAAKADLTAFPGCDPLLDQIKTQALERVTAYGLSDPSGTIGIDDMAGPLAARSEETAPEYTGTNNQEVGVDEADSVKTNGRLIVVAGQDVIRVFKVTDGATRKAGSIKVSGYDHKLLLHNDQLLVLSRDNEENPARGSASPPLPEQGRIANPDGQWWGNPVLHITEVNLSNPDSPAIADVVRTEGEYVDARMIDGTARIVVSSDKRPRLVSAGFQYGSPESDVTDELTGPEALQANREIINDSTIQDWLPATGVNGAEPNVVDCTKAMAPSEDSGLGILSVVALNPAAAGQDTIADVTSILSDGHEVYANSRNLYVATPRYLPGDDPVPLPMPFSPFAEPATTPQTRTSIHRFNISDLASRYVGSGTVAGRLLDQFAMSEHNNVLRVASTSGQPWDDASQSHVTMLELQDDQLEQVGQVSGLGKGERIYAVRMIEDTAYVVTFRQTDPFYVVDLADPANPIVAGELKIPGYSAYLHPVGEDLILGIGQEATDTGRTTGTQASLFNVANPADPQRVDQWTAPVGSHSAVDHDHHAFLFEPETKTIVIPVAGQQATGGVQVLTLDGQNLLARGTVTHPDGETWSINRSLIINDQLFTIGINGIGVNDLATLAHVQWVPNAP